MLQRIGAISDVAPAAHLVGLDLLRHARGHPLADTVTDAGVARLRGETQQHGQGGECGEGENKLASHEALHGTP